MADSWEDEEFEPQLPSEKSEAPTSWEDEEEEDIPRVDLSKVGQKPQLSEAAKKRQEQKLAASKEARLAELLDAEESAEDRKLRERRLIEEGDHALTDELFGSQRSEEGVVIKLKDLKDHLALVQTINEKMVDSKKNHIVAFCKELLRSNEHNFEEKDCSDLILILQTQRDAKQKANKKVVVPSKKANKGKSKKDLAEIQKKVEDNFGSATTGGEYDHYEDQFDDFF